MRREQKKEIKVIKEDNPELFEKRVNAVFEQLAKEDIAPGEPLYSLNPLTALIPYERTEYIATSETDKELLKGHTVICRNCGYYESGTDYRIGYCNLKCRRVYAEKFACKEVKNDK